MAITILSKQPENFGSLSGAVGQGQMDSSYPTGGYTLNASTFSLTSMQSFYATTTGGYALVYNYSTSKLMVFTSAGGGAGNTGLQSVTNTPSAVTMDPYTPAGSVGTSSITEAVAIAGDTGTLAFVPVNVTAIYVTAGGATGPYDIIPSGAGAPAAGQVSVNFGTGALIFNAADAVTACSVVYQNSGGNFTGTPASLTGTAAAQTNSPHQHSVSASGGGFTEVSNGTNLSSVIFNYELMGY